MPLMNELLIKSFKLNNFKISWKKDFISGMFLAVIITADYHNSLKSFFCLKNQEVICLFIHILDINVRWRKSHFDLHGQQCDIV